ncbi:MAG: S24 family peptidase [Cyanobacteria bacterium J06627_28]
MGFPIPGNAIEQSLDLNQRLLKHSASTFVMQVEPTMTGGDEVSAGDLLIVDRARTPQTRSLVVAIIENELVVTRFELAKAPLEVWGVVSALIRENP